MQPHEVPFNVEIFNPEPQKFRTLKPVTALDMFEGGDKTKFHEEGLFSTVIFGRIGSEDRDKRFSYIDIRAPVFHPFIYKAIVKLKGLYRAIMSGRGYAVWDPKEKDFVQSDELHGQTGYHFFFSHWRDIEFKRTGSDQRDQRIAMIEKFRDAAVTDKVLVMPAGLRDVQINDDGQIKNPEINEFYHRILSISNTVGRGGNTPVVDVSRWSLQRAFNDLYEHIESLIAGKDKFIQDKWAKRRVFNGTRNVFSTMDTAPAVLGEINTITPNHTVVGLYQAMKGLLPMVKHSVRTGWVDKVFNTAEGKAVLVDKKTLKSKAVEVAPETVDRWTSNDGIEKIINAYADHEMRSRAIEIEDHYLGLIYIGPDQSFRIFGDIDELPEDRNRDDVYPLNYAEFFYLSQYMRWYEYAVFVTRYPITGEGSTYPSIPYVKTTIVGEVRTELGEDWRPIEGYVAREFPSRKNPVHLDSLVPHTTRLGGLGGDFDGDTGSANFVYTENAIREVRKRLKSRAAYVDPNGGLKASPIVSTTKLVIRNMTGD